MALQTRKPTGQVAFPLILVEGEEKAGKSFMLAQATASPRIGRSFMLDLADGTMDEYASLGDYEILIHDGTWSSMIGQIRAAAAEPSDPAKPNLIGVDAGTLLWGLQKDRATQRARRSRTAQAKLREDPDADIDVSMNYWNEAKDRWAELLRVLRMFPGIGIISALGREVTKVDSSGQPTREKEWSVDIEKTTPAASTAWIRIRRPHAATLVGIRKLGVEIPPQGLVLPNENVIDHVVFEILGAGSGFAVVTAPAPTMEIDRAEAKTRLLQAVETLFPNLTNIEQKAEAGRIWGAAQIPEAQLGISPTTLADLLAEVGLPHEPQTPPAPPEAPTPPATPGEPPAAESGADGGDLSARTISDMKKPEVVAKLVELGLPTNGSVGDLRLRLIEATAPFEPAAYSDPEVAQGSPADAVGHLQAAFGDVDVEDDLPTVRDVPDGWVEETCYCGEPAIHAPGQMTETLVHLDPALDHEHPAEIPF